MAIGRPIRLTPNVASKAISVEATASQTSFTPQGGYRINNIAVYRNGIRLVEGKDFTAQDGTTVVLLAPATAGDAVDFQIFDDFNIAGAISANESSQTIAGDLTITGTFNADNISNSGVATVGFLTATDVWVSGGTTTNAATVNTTISCTDINVSGSATVDGQLSIGGTITYEDVTNVDSVGLVTGRLGVRVLAGGIQAVGFYTGLSASGVATLGGNVSVGGSIAFGDGAAKGGYWGNADDLGIYHDGTDSVLKNDTGELKLMTDTFRVRSNDNSETLIRALKDGAVELYYDDAKKLETINQGVIVTGITTTTQLSVGPGVLRESYNEYGSALNGTYNQDVLTTGMSLYYSSNATATFVINLRGNGSTTFNSLIKEGESTIFTLYHGSNNTSYYLTDFQIDGSSITEEWSGGSAPSAATGSGYDVYTFNILKTGNAAFKVFANVANFN